MEKLKIRRATFTYIYSFLPVTEEMMYDAGIMEKCCNAKGKPDEPGSSYNRVGLSSYLCIKPLMFFEKMEEMDAEYKNLKIKIYPLIRAFANGCSLTFHIEAVHKTNSFISTEELFPLIHLVSTEGNKKAKVKLNITGKGEISIYDLYKEIKDKKIKSAKKNLNAEIKPQCEDEDLILIDKEIESKVPWVITNLELIKENETVSFLFRDYPDLLRSEATKKKLEEIRPYENELAHYLYRIVDEKYGDFKTDPFYESFETLKRFNGLNSLYLDSRFYIQASRRSILTITEDKYKNPGSYLLPTLYDICEITHTRWQSLILLNMNLDIYVRIFSNHSVDTMLPSEKLKIMLNSTKRILANTENPILYTVSGDTLKEISEVLGDTFKLKELEENALKKLNLLEKIFEIGLSIKLL
jgi:hypothetical protein